MITPELKATLEAQAEKHEIRGQAFNDLLDWIEDGITRNGIIENVEKGFMEIVAMKNGEPYFNLTPAGMKYAEALPHHG